MYRISHQPGIFVGAFDDRRRGRGRRGRDGVDVVGGDDVGDGRRSQLGEDLKVEKDDLVRPILDRVHQHREQVVHMEEEAVRSLLVQMEDPTQDGDAGLRMG